VPRPSVDLKAHRGRRLRRRKRGTEAADEQVEYRSDRELDTSAPITFRKISAAIERLLSPRAFPAATKSSSPRLGAGAH